ncbi:HAD family hydrolase [Candidatus Saccharibacteria bacterium]|nr:HAD family hydrolase [Candidatus Saccharibacteria bacterium]
MILDFDDFTVMTEAPCFDLENNVLARMGRPPMPRELHIATWGRPLFEAILERSPGVNVEEFRAIYGPLVKEYTADGRLDGIPAENLAAIDELRSLGKGVLILTSREGGEIPHLLVADHPLTQRLDGGVDGYYYKDNMKYHKPDPRAFEHIEALHGWKPNECVYAGDSVGDAQAAKGAGLHFIAGLESGLRAREDFDAFPVDVFINRFPEIVGAVKQIESNLTTRGLVE